MPKILSGAVLQQGSDQSFLTLSGAQPALQPTPSTTTGFTLVVDPVTVVAYSNILGNITFDQGTLANYNENQDIAIYTPGGGAFQVFSKTFLNSDVLIVSTTTSYSSTSGSLVLTGGMGVQGPAYFGANIPATSDANGSLVVQGGAGISGDLFLGGNLVFTNAGNGTLTSQKIVVLSTESSVSTSTGALIVAGGVGVGGSLNASKVFDSGTRVISKINVGAGLAINTTTGPTVFMTNTGVLSLTAGTGTFVSSTTGNITVWIKSQEGATTLQFVTDLGATTTNPVYFNNATNSTASNTGSVIIAGGLGVGQDVYVGGTINATNLNVTNAVDSTLLATNGVFGTVAITGTNYNTTTYSSNALYIAGGVGMSNGFIAGGTSYIYGNLVVFGTQTIVNSVTADVGRKVVALSTSAGPAILAIDSGITVGPVASPFVKFLYDGVSAWRSTGDILPSVANTYNLGNGSLPWLTVTGNKLVATGGTQATSTLTGSLVVAGGAGISGNIVYGGVLRGLDTTVSTGTNTGAVILAGGLGINGNINAGGSINARGTSTFRSTASAINQLTGAVVIAGGLGVGGSLYAGNIFSNGVLVGSGGGGGYAAVFGGTDTSISTSGNVLSVWSTATLQSVSDRGNSTTNAIKITNGTVSNDPTTGALTVTGGVGIGGTLNVAGAATFLNGVTFYGTVTNVLTTNTVYSDNVIEIHAPKSGLLALNDGKDIGVKFTYYLNTITNGTSFLGRAADTGYLEWYNTSTENITGTFTGSYGTFKTGNIVLVNTSTSTIAGPVRFDNTVTITSLTTSGSTVTGALVIGGGVGIGNNLNVGGTIRSAGTIYMNGSAVLTAASLSNYGVAQIHGGTGTSVSGDGTGDVTIWNSSNLQSVTDTGNSTTNVILITNSSTSVSTETGALVVYGGVGIKGNVNIGNTLTVDTILSKKNVFLAAEVAQLDVVDRIAVTGTRDYPVEIFGTSDHVSSYYVYNANSGTNSYVAYTMQNHADDYVEFGLNGRSRTYDAYDAGSAFIYLTPDIKSFNVGNKSDIKFYTQDITGGNDPILELATTGTVSLTGNLMVKDNSFDPNPYASVLIQSNARAGHSSLTLQNTSLDGHSYTIDVGGSNRASQGGVAINEGSFTLYDNVQNAYRLIVAKTTGNIIIGGATDDGVNKLQVSGTITATSVIVESTATFRGNTLLNGPTSVNNTSTFNSTATFNKTLVIGSSALETSVTPINTTNQTSIDSFDATLYRSARSVVQITEGDTYHLVEVVLLHDNVGQVYISQYGIISTAGLLGEFTAELVNGRVVLYFTAAEATAKTINVVRTSISV